MTTKQIELWQGPFGDNYTERNSLNEEDLGHRQAFWMGALQILYMNCPPPSYVPKTILEYGAGAGANLVALDRIYKGFQNSTSTDMSTDVKLYATEVNEKTRKILKANVPQVELLEDATKYNEPFVDLAFTYGVLIHIHPAHRLSVMKEIYKASKKWIICCEYFAPNTRPIDYRGEKDALWLDDYGSLWLDNFNVRYISHMFSWKRVNGLDNVTIWVFEKVN